MIDIQNSLITYISNNNNNNTYIQFKIYAMTITHNNIVDHYNIFAS